MTTATTKPAAKQDRATMALLFIAALVAVGGIGFAAGHLTAPAGTGADPGNGRNPNGFQRPSFAAGQSFNPGNFGGNLGIGGATIEGTVQSIDGSTLTIKLTSGSTVTVNLSGTTTYHNETAATSSDVKTGSTVMIQIDGTGLGGGNQIPGGPGASGAPANPGASGAPGVNRTFTARDVLITTP